MPSERKNDTQGKPKSITETRISIMSENDANAVRTRERRGPQHNNEAWGKVKDSIKLFMIAVTDFASFQQQNRLIMVAVQNLQQMISTFYTKVFSENNLQDVHKKFKSNTENIIGYFLKAYVGLAQFKILLNQFPTEIDKYDMSKQRVSDTLLEVFKKSTLNDNEKPSWLYISNLLTGADEILEAVMKRSAVLVSDKCEEEFEANTVICNGVVFARGEIIPTNIISDTELSDKKNKKANIKKFIESRQLRLQQIEHDMKKENATLSGKISTALLKKNTLVNRLPPEEISKATIIAQYILELEMIERFQTKLFPDNLDLRTHYKNAMSTYGTESDVLQRKNEKENNDLDFFLKKSVLVDILEIDYDIKIDDFKNNKKYEDYVILKTQHDKGYIFKRSYLIQVGEEKTNQFFQCKNDYTIGSKIYIKLDLEFTIAIAIEEYVQFQEGEYRIFWVEPQIGLYQKYAQLEFTMPYAKTLDHKGGKRLFCEHFQNSQMDLYRLIRKDKI